MTPREQTNRLLALAYLKSALDAARKNEGFAFLSYTHGLIDGLQAAGVIDVEQAGRLNDLVLNAHQYAQRDAW